MDYFFLAQTSQDAAANWFVSLGVVWILLAVLLSVFWVWMLVESLTNTSLSSTEKVVWSAVIFFFPFLGALIYLFLGRRPRAGGA